MLEQDNDEDGMPEVFMSKSQDFQKYVDIFDAGPSMQCDRQHIEILKKAKHCKITGTHKKPIDAKAQHYILSNGNLENYKI